MTITICGSMKFHQEMRKVARDLKSQGHTVQLPKSIHLMDAEGYVHPDDEDEKAQAKITHDFIRDHFRKIEQSEAILVLNYDKNGIQHYVGGNTFLEIGIAYWLRKQIYFLNAIPDVAYKAEIVAMQPVVLNGNLSLISSLR